MMDKDSQTRQTAGDERANRCFQAQMGTQQLDWPPNTANNLGADLTRELLKRNTSRCAALKAMLLFAQVQHARTWVGKPKVPRLGGLT
eukprot:1147331-Pelagomonas_calceolata.AAC.7